MNKPLSKKKIWLLVILVAAIGIAIWIISVKEASDRSSATVADTTNWQTFTSNPKGYSSLADIRDGFSFKYPAGWTIAYGDNPRAILTLYDPEISVAIATCKQKQNTECPGDTGIDLFGVSYASSSDDFFIRNYPDYEKVVTTNGLDVFKYEPSGNPVVTYHINFPDKKEAVEFSPENLINSDYAQVLSQIIQTVRVNQQ